MGRDRQKSEGSPGRGAWSWDLPPGGSMHIPAPFRVYSCLSTDAPHVPLMGTKCQAPKPPFQPLGTGEWQQPLVKVGAAALLRCWCLAGVNSLRDHGVQRVVGSKAAEAPAPTQSRPAHGVPGRQRGQLSPPSTTGEGQGGEGN